MERTRYPAGRLTAGAMFEVLHAPVCSQEDSKVTDIVFIDGGSNMIFVTHTLAGKLDLVGTRTSIYFWVVNKQYWEKEVLVFRLGVEDRFKVIHWMGAVGVDSITDTQAEGIQLATNYKVQYTKCSLQSAVYKVHKASIPATKVSWLDGGEAVAKYFSFKIRLFSEKRYNKL